MGMPTKLIGLLKQWATGFRIHLRINGGTCPPFEQHKGFPQGTMSPILLTLMIEPLLRYLNRRRTTHGVCVACIR